MHLFKKVRNAQLLIKNVIYQFNMIVFIQVGQIRFHHLYRKKDYVNCMEEIINMSKRNETNTFIHQITL